MEEERSLVFACLRFALEVVLRAERRAFETVGVELNGFMVVKIGYGASNRKFRPTSSRAGV